MRAKIFPKTDDSSIIYFPDSLRILVADNATTTIVNEIVKGEDDKLHIIHKYNITEKDYLLLANYCDDMTNHGSEMAFNEKRLTRLVINISDECNLMCRYCYAGGGAYGCCEYEMHKSLVDRILNMFYTKFFEIGTIQLFGGEPTLNIDLIEHICDYVKREHSHTSIGLVTNGTLASDRLISLINDFNIRITVSIDCKESHDYMRPFATGEPSFATIRDNIIIMKEATGQPTQLEITYTKMHDDMNISLSALISSIKNDLKYDIPVHIAPVCTLSKNYQLVSPRRFIDSINDYFNCLNTDKRMHFSFVDRFLRPIYQHKRKDTICGAGTETIAVSTNGDIYPCFFFVGDNRYKTCNILNIEQAEFDRKIDEMRYSYAANNRKIGKCHECFANTVCFGCLGINQTIMRDPYASSEFHCDLIKGALEQTIVNLCNRRLCS